MVIIPGEIIAHLEVVLSLILIGNPKITQPTTAMNINSTQIR